MHHVLVYGDSLTWGIVPNTRKRFPFDERWPGILENKLNELGPRVRLIEDCLNGRRTVWEDPFKPGRNGLAGLAQCMEKHSPLALVILMLGTNDFQFSHPYNNAWSAAQGIATLVNEIRKAPIEPGMPIPPILVICPPPICISKGSPRRKILRRGTKVRRPRRCVQGGLLRSRLPFLRRRERDLQQPRGWHSPRRGPASGPGTRSGGSGGSALARA